MKHPKGFPCLGSIAQRQCILYQYNKIHIIYTLMFAIKLLIVILNFASNFNKRLSINDDFKKNQ